MTGLVRQLTHLGVPCLMGLSGQLQINSLTALTPGTTKTCLFYSQCWKTKLQMLTQLEDFHAYWKEQEDALGEQRRRWMNKTLISALSLACKSWTKHIMVMMKRKYCKDSPWLNHSSNYQKSSKRKTKIYRKEENTKEQSQKGRIS